MGTNLKLIQTTISNDTLRLVLLSDTHELHRGVKVPDGDILIHAGDFTRFSKSMSAIADFNTWLGELPHRHKILIYGNHEFFIETDPSRRSMLTNAHVLINEETEIEGLRIWGSPVTPLYSGAFGLSSSEDRKQLYDQIPEDIDILITHGPPYGILDSVSQTGHHSGCRELFDAVMRVRPKLHVFGHVHGAHGILHTNQTVFVNAVLLGSNGDLNQDPVLVRNHMKRVALCAPVSTHRSEHRDPKQ
jgi:Icc-related predicted phosphoesterase